MSTSQQKQQKQQNDTAWSELLILAEAEQEQFQDVEVITTRAHYVELLWNAALQYNVVDEEDLIRTMIHVHNTGHIKTCEHVSIDDQRIRIVVNSETIDEDATYKALRLLAATMERSTTYQQFSPKFRYETTEIPWLFIH